MDVDAATAETVARRVGAAHTTRAEDIFGDPSVDVVVICSPSQFHAAQVIAACRADVKAVLCEKPFAMTAEEASQIAEVSAETGVPIIVGAMHTFDPAWLAAQKEWGALVATSHTIRSTVVIPPNALFEDLATDIVSRPAVAPANEPDAEAAVRAVSGGIMGLAIHDLPLIRQFLPSFKDLDVLRAEFAPPWGYVISATASGKTVHLQAATADVWAPTWTLEVIGDDLTLQVTFTPSYVQGGSSVATLHTGTESHTFGPFALSGYEAEWMNLARIARGQGTPPPSAQLIDDLRLAIALADQSSMQIRNDWKSVA
jgi:myo-inositol 2-dehydrogenase/D-chiro-inositol 1-dehydrogenase